MTRQQVISVAAANGFEIVRLPDGSRLVLSGETITAHYARGVFPRAIRNPFAGVAV